MKKLPVKYVFSEYNDFKVYLDTPVSIFKDSMIVITRKKLSLFLTKKLGLHFTDLDKQLYFTYSSAYDYTNYDKNLPRYVNINLKGKEVERKIKLIKMLRPELTKTNFKLEFTKTTYISEFIDSITGKRKVDYYDEKYQYYNESVLELPKIDIQYKEKL